MTEYSKIATGSYTVTTGTLGSVAPDAKIINLPFKPQSVELWNYTQGATPAQNGVPSLYWNSAMGQGTGVFQAFNATPVLTTDNITTGGISTFEAGLMLQYGTRIQISGITKADPAVVTTASAHGYSSGDVVIFQGLYQSSTTGMAQIADMPFTVTVTGATTFTIPWNTNQSNYTALSGSPTGAYVKKVLYPYLYQPGAVYISALTAPNGSTVSANTIRVDTTDAHNFVVGQEVAFRIPSVYGSIELNSLPNLVIPGSPIYYYVVEVTDYNTFVVQASNAATFTAFNSNQPISAVPGLQFAQVVAVGDVNTGGVQISNGSQLYPPPYTVAIGTTRTNTINGPAIQGSYFNNTSQGFIIGPGAGVTLTSAFIGGATNDVMFWRAMYYDMVV